MRVLDEKRSNALAIMSSQLPSRDALKLAIIEMDNKMVKEEHLSELITQIDISFNFFQFVAFSSF